MSHRAFLLSRAYGFLDIAARRCLLFGRCHCVPLSNITMQTGISRSLFKIELPKHDYLQRDGYN
jgi:hypothetical protein